MAQEKSPLPIALWICAGIFFLNYILYLYWNKNAIAILCLFVSCIFICLTQIEALKHKEVLNEIGKKTLVSVASSLIVAVVLFLLKTPLLKEWSQAYQGNSAVKMVGDFNANGKYELAKISVNYYLTEVDLNKATRSTLVVMGKISEDAIAKQQSRYPLEELKTQNTK